MHTVVTSLPLYITPQLMSTSVSWVEWGNLRYVAMAYVLATTGGWGPSASMMYKRLASLIADNTTK